LPPYTQQSIVKHALFIFFFILYQPLFAEKPHYVPFLSVSDIHFDPFSVCVNTSPCPLIEELNHAAAKEWHSILTAINVQTPIDKKNTPYRLLVSTFSEFQRIADQKHPRFVLVLGDLLAHEYPEAFSHYSSDKTPAAYQAFVKKSMDFLALEFKQVFPKTDVYYVVGNHDTYHQPYSSTPQGLFFKDMAATWSTLIEDRKTQEQMQQSFPTGGYYAIDLPTSPHLSLIVLNSVLFSNKARGTGITQAAEKELDWLHDTLNTAYMQQKHVIIALHIPVGVDVYASVRQAPQIVEWWHPTYSERFLTELRTYATNISAILPGHFHMDWSQVYSTPDEQHIPIAGTPAISALFGNQPAFKLFSYNAESLQLHNAITYAYSLKDNHWNESYDFNALYQPSCEHCELVDGINAIRPTGASASYYQQFFAAGTTSPLIHTLWNPYLWCNIHTIAATDFQRCLMTQLLM